MAKMDEHWWFCSKPMVILEDFTGKDMEIVLRIETLRTLMGFSMI